MTARARALHLKHQEQHLQCKIQPPSPNSRPSPNSPWSTRELSSWQHYEHDVKQDFSIYSRILGRTIAGTLTSHFHGRFLLGAICKRIHLFTHNFYHSTFELNDAKAMAQNALPLAPRYLLLLFASLRLLSPVLLPSRFSGLLPRSHLNTLNKCCWNVRHKLQMPLLYGWYPLKKPLRAG